MTQRLTITEVINLTSSANASNLSPYMRAQKYNEHRTKALDDILKIVYSGKKWLLPAGAPPYTPNRIDDTKYNLYNQARRMHYFVEGSPVTNPIKREQMFIELLESVDPEDAETIIKLKDGWKPYNYSMAVRLGVAEPRVKDDNTESVEEEV